MNFCHIDAEVQLADSQANREKQLSALQGHFDRNLIFKDNMANLIEFKPDAC